MSPSSLPSMPRPQSQPEQNNVPSRPSVSPYRQLKVEDALAYLDEVKSEFAGQPHVYNRFLDIMKEFKAQTIDTPGVIDGVLQLFHGRRNLIIGFNVFLPPGYKIELSDTDNNYRVSLKYPEGRTGPQPSNPTLAGPTVPPQQATASPPLAMAPSLAAPPARKAPIEFDQAIDYVTKIKTRFANQPEIYKSFLEILHTYQKEQKTIREVYDQVSSLFKDHVDLLGEFSQFLPDDTGVLRVRRNTARWRMVTHITGKLMLAHRRAVEHAYAPEGAGYVKCRDEFLAIAERPHPRLSPLSGHWSCAPSEDEVEVGTGTAEACAPVGGAVEDAVAITEADIEGMGVEELRAHLRRMIHDRSGAGGS
jgi:histone deacetylase complex regulatory component SIN3